MTLNLRASRLMPLLPEQSRLIVLPRVSTIKIAITFSCRSRSAIDLTRLAHWEKRVRPLIDKANGTKGSPLRKGARHICSLEQHQ
jgi:hypothetical protein